MRSTLLFAVLAFFTVSGHAQNAALPHSTRNKGKLYFYWGWNRAAYTKSDLHFSGPDYDFTLENVVAKDRQTHFDTHVYFNFKKATIPQYNFRLGYFLTEHLNLSFGIDHMKYVVQNNQRVKINGSIHHSDSGYNGDYAADNILLRSDFLQFEHTDGLNYLNLELRNQHTLWDLGRVRLNLTEGLGAGVLLPRTNTTLLDYKRYDEFHLAGFGLGAMGGLNLEIFRHFFVQVEFKTGYINMPDIRTTEFASDKATQQFLYVQGNLVFGAIFNLMQ
ncbi:MAG: hypothetical protein IT260_16460 [Saprospiraceae bacterium]|nr:hypothetical protein [Saprospiraceae bacterium]